MSSSDVPAETGTGGAAAAGAWPSSAEGAAEGVPDGAMENNAAEGMAALAVHSAVDDPAASPSEPAAGERDPPAAAASASSSAASAAAAVPPAAAAASASVSIASIDDDADIADDFDPLHLLSRKGPVSGVRDDTEPGDRTQRFSVHSSQTGQSGGFTKIRVEDIERDLSFLRAPSLNHCMQFLQACTRRCQYRDLDEKDPLGIGVCREVTTTCESVAELEKALRECEDKDLKPLLQLQLADVLMFGLLGIPNERRDSSRACNLYYDAAEGGHPVAMTQVSLINLLRINVELGRGDDRDAIDPLLLNSEHFGQLLFWLGEAADRHHFSPFAMHLVRSLGVPLMERLQQQGVAGVKSVLRLYRPIAKHAQKRIDLAQSSFTSRADLRQQQPGHAGAGAGAGAAPSSKSAAEPGASAPAGTLCSACGVAQPRSHFASTQLKKPAAARKCRACAGQPAGQEQEQQPGQ